MLLNSSGHSRLAGHRRALAAAVGLLALILGWTPARAQRGALTLPQNLAELVDEAGVIVRARVLSTRVEPHPDFRNLYTVVVTLSVEKTLKGRSEDTFTFRQFIWDVRDRYNAAGYEKGQHLLLLVLQPNQYGLASPAGLEQGRFRLQPGPAGRLTALNGADNAGLFRNLDIALERKGLRLRASLAAMVRQHESGAVPLEDLEEIINTLVVTRQ